MLALLAGSLPVGFLMAWVGEAAGRVFNAPARHDLGAGRALGGLPVGNGEATGPQGGREGDRGPETVSLRVDSPDFSLCSYSRAKQ